MKIIRIFNKTLYFTKLYIYWRGLKLPVPYDVSILLSSRCNLRCAMCNTWKLAKKKPEVINNELSTQNLKDLFKELSKMGTKSITLSGGEPTIRDDICDIIKYAKDEKFQVNMITNGALITEDLAKGLVNSGIDSIIFSIDGHVPEIHEKIRRVNGCWEKAIQGLKFIKHAKEKFNVEKPIIGVNHLVSNISYQYVEKLIELKCELGYDTISFIPIIKKVSGVEEFILKEEDLEKLEKKLKFLEIKIKDVNLPKSTISPLITLCKNKKDTLSGEYTKSINRDALCFAPWSMTTIDPFGNIYPCCYACTFQNLSEDLEHSYCGGEEFNMGNIKNNSFKQIWIGKKYNQLREMCKKPPSFSMCDCCNEGVSERIFLTKLFKNHSFMDVLKSIKIKF